MFIGVGEKENGIDGTREVGKEHTQMVVILAFIQQVMRNWRILAVKWHDRITYTVESNNYSK